jgi:hypothetical protein
MFVAVLSGVPAQIGTSYVERSHLTLRQSSKRFAHLGNGFSKRLEPHCAAVSLYVAYYNLTRVHESLKCTPAMALSITDRVWTISDLIEAALATQPITPVTTAPERRKLFEVIEKTATVSNPQAELRPAAALDDLQNFGDLGFLLDKFTFFIIDEGELHFAPQGVARIKGDLPIVKIR